MNTYVVIVERVFERLLIEAESKNLSKKTIETLRSWVMNHRKVKQKDLTTAFEELRSKTPQPTSSDIVYRGLIMSPADLSKLTGKDVEGGWKDSGRAKGPITYHPLKSVSSWTPDLNKAVRFSHFYNERTFSSMQKKLNKPGWENVPGDQIVHPLSVIISTNANQSMFRSIPAEAYEKTATGWEKEVLSFGPVQVSNVWWKTEYNAFPGLKIPEEKFRKPWDPPE